MDRQYAGEHRQLQQGHNERLWSGQPEIATALPQPGSVSHQQPDSDTVHAIHLAHVEHDSRSFTRGKVEGCLQGLRFLARNNAALTLNDVDVATKARLQTQRHGFLVLMIRYITGQKSKYGGQSAGQDQAGLLRNIVQGWLS
jgi:hypothetical protein